MVKPIANPHPTLVPAARRLEALANRAIERLSDTKGRPRSAEDVRLLTDLAVAASSWLAAVHRSGGKAFQRPSARDEFAETDQRITVVHNGPHPLGNSAKSATLALRALKAVKPTAEDLGNVSRLVRIALAEADMYVASLYRDGDDEAADALDAVTNDAVVSAADALEPVLKE